MINNYANKIANQVIVDNLHMIPKKINELSSICIKEENTFGIAYSLYAIISNKTKKIKFDVLPYKEIVGSTYSMERFHVCTMYSDYRKNGHSEKNLDLIIKHVIENLIKNCI